MLGDTYSERCGAGPNMGVNVNNMRTESTQVWGQHALGSTKSARGLIPQSFSSRKNGRDNPLLMKYPRMHQRRFHNKTCADLCIYPAQAFSVKAAKTECYAGYATTLSGNTEPFFLLSASGKSPRR